MHCKKGENADASDSHRKPHVRRIGPLRRKRPSRRRKPHPQGAVKGKRQQDESSFQRPESRHSVQGAEDRCKPGSPAERERIDRKVHEQKPTERHDARPSEQALDERRYGARGRVRHGA
jgi:hypothetical protein